MIVRLSGRIVERGAGYVVMDVGGIAYEVLVPASVLERMEEHRKPDGTFDLMVYHYLQVSPSSALPVLVGFLSKVEKDFFQQFIKVSGIGPRAAVKALNQPISRIAKAIADNDVKFLTTLPGIGNQKAKEIVAKLQGKAGKYGLIQDSRTAAAPAEERPADRPDWQEEALDVLLQLQYKRAEASDMIRKALKRAPEIVSAEALLNEIYKQRTQR